MNTEFKSRIDDLNLYINRLEGKVKRATVVNTIIYGIIVLLFLVYAYIIPNEVNKYASPQEGPETLVALVEGSIPDNSVIIAETKSQIPDVVDSGVEHIWGLMPDAERMVLDGMS